MAVINGDDGSDVITGTRNNDRIRGFGGPDVIVGGPGADIVFGGTGNDIADTGSDSGQRAGDRLFGGAGDDTLDRFNPQQSGSGATDLLYGGAGADWLRATANRNSAVLDGGAGRDRLNITFTRSPEDSRPDDRGLAPVTVFGGAGDDFIEAQSFRGLSISAGKGNDFVDLTAGVGPGDWIAPLGGISGGTGTDLVMVGGAGDMTVDFSAGQNLVRSSAFDALLISGFERIGVRAGDGNDSVIGSALDDQIDVGAGRNNVDASQGNDTVRTEARGQDQTLDGGDGDDALSIVLAVETTFDAGANASAGLTITGFERLSVYAESDITTDVVLGFGDDLFQGFTNNVGEDTVIPSLTSFDTVYGRAGDDVLTGGDAADRLFGGQDNDFLNGGAGIDFLFGDKGDDSLVGGDGTDLLYGGLGDDVLILSGDSGKLAGGDGADSFVFVGGGVGPLQIRDFDVEEGDRIDLSRIGGLPNAPAPDLAFIGGDGFNRVAGEVRSYFGPANTTIAVDRNGDGAADMKLVLIGVRGVDGDALIL